MTDYYFKLETQITFRSADGDRILSYRHYNPDEMVMGKPMEDHLCFAVCY